MTKLYFSPNALQDIEGIRNYILEELSNPKAAQNTINIIKDKLNNLKAFPDLGAPLSSLVAFETNYRFLVCGSYLAFYRYQGAAVYIDRILYGRRDYLSVLFGKSPGE